MGARGFITNAGEFVATLVFMLSPSSRVFDKVYTPRICNPCAKRWLASTSRPLYELMPSENHCVVFHSEGFARPVLVAVIACAGLYQLARPSERARWFTGLAGFAAVGFSGYLVFI